MKQSISMLLLGLLLTFGLTISTAPSLRRFFGSFNTTFTQQRLHIKTAVQLYGTYCVPHVTQAAELNYLAETREINCLMVTHNNAARRLAHLPKRTNVLSMHIAVGSRPHYEISA